MHELSHATGHETRLNRDLSGTFGSESYAKEELIAELGSVFLCSYLNIQSSIRHEAYLKSWLGAIKAEPKLLWKSASEAQKILDYLDGNTTLEEAVYILKRDTRHFAKRQLTWFRREHEVIWVEKEKFSHDNGKILDFMKKELTERGIL